MLTVDSYRVPGYNSVLLLLHCNAASAAGTYFSRFALNIGSVICDSSCGNANWHQDCGCFNWIWRSTTEAAHSLCDTFGAFKAFTANNVVH